MPKNIMKSFDPERIHEASLALLDEPGVRMEHDGICKQLIAAGAKPGAAAQVVRFPKEMVMDHLRRCPEEVAFANRQGIAQVVGKGRPAAIWSVPGMSILRHGEHRPFTSADMADMARLLDQLDQADGVFGMALSDVPPAARDVVGLRIMAQNTGKHIRVLCFTPDGADRLVEMRRVVGDHSWFSVGFTAHGPLRWTQLSLEIFLRTAGHGIPVTINGEPMAGVSGPVTLAGAIAVGNAEILAGLVVNQVLEPGRPCIHNLGLAHVFDMRTAIAVTGGPENHLMAVAGAELGRFYNIPSCSWVSTESMGVDSQAALEKMAGYLTHLQAGVGVIWGMGQLESELTVAPAQAVIDNEIIAYSRRFLRGVPVSDEALALDVVRSVGISGSFLAEDHTLDHFREEIFEPSILFRKNRAAWQAEGARPLDRVAEEKADALIARPRGPHLTPDQEQALLAIEQGFLKTMNL